MKKLSALLLALIMVFSLAACSKGEDGKENPSENAQGNNATESNLIVSKEEYASMSADQLVAKCVKDVNNVTTEEYIDLVSTYAYVEAPEKINGVVPKDNITYKALSNSDGIKLKYDNVKFSQAYKALYKSESPVARGWVLKVNSIFSKDNYETTKELMSIEKHPYVLWFIVNKAGAKGAEDPEVKQFLLTMAKNDNPGVREETADALGNIAYNGQSDVLDAMLELTKDSDEKVKNTALGTIGLLGDESVIETLEAVLNDSAQTDFHQGAVEGLVNLWYKNLSEKAYKATIKYFDVFSSSKPLPPSYTLTKLNVVNYSGVEEWKTKATYYNPKEIAQLMLKYVLNENSDNNTTTNAINAMGAHCSKAILDEIKPSIDGYNGTYKISVQANFERVYNNAK